MGYTLKDWIKHIIEKLTSTTAIAIAYLVIFVGSFFLTGYIVWGAI